MVGAADGSESSVDPDDLHDIMLNLAIESAVRFGDREPTEEEMHDFLLERLLGEGKSRAEAERILGDVEP